MSMSQVATFFGFSRKEVQEAIGDLVERGELMLSENGRLTLADGTLAGADLELATAVRVMHQQVGIELGEALRMAALYPAMAMEFENGGRLGPGLPADFVWLNDDLIPGATWVGGHKIDIARQPATPADTFV